MWQLTFNCTKTVHTLFTLGRDILKVPFSLILDGKEIAEEKTPRYLGVLLDRKLSLFEHIKEVKNKASSRLSIVKRLVTSKWGAKAGVLRTLYMGYVRALIE